MRLVPVVRGPGVDLQRQRQQYRGEGGVLHGVLHDRQCRCDFVIGHFKNQLVVDLQQHLRRELVLGQRVFHPGHGAADDVGRGAL
jgi:hypothetical protein